MKKIISLLIATIIVIFGSDFTANAYSDVNMTKEQGIAIESLTSQAIMTGNIDNTFKPNAPATRAEVAKVLAIAKGFDFENVIDPGFSDIPTSHPYYAFIAALANKDIVSGSNNKFNPNQTVTRGQVSKMLVRTFGLTGAKKMPFKDANNSGFKKEIEAMYANAITIGTSNTTFGVNKPVTRGQLALFIHRIQQVQNPSPLNGVWTGHYLTSSNKKMQLKLTIAQNIGVFEFKSPDGVSGVSYSKMNYDEETGIFKTTDRKWYIQPSGYSLGDFEGTITPNNYLSGFFIFGSSVTTMELQNERSYPQDATSYLNGQWEGTSIMNTSETQTALYTFDNYIGSYTFGPTPQSPNVKKGAYGIKITTSNVGLFKLTPTGWIDQPNGYSSTEKSAVISKKGYIFGYTENDSSRRFIIKKDQ